VEAAVRLVDVPGLVFASFKRAAQEIIGFPYLPSAGFWFPSSCFFLLFCPVSRGTPKRVGPCSRGQGLAFEEAPKIALF